MNTTPYYVQKYLRWIEECRRDRGTLVGAIRDDNDAKVTYQRYLAEADRKEEERRQRYEQKYY